MGTKTKTKGKGKGKNSKEVEAEEDEAAMLAEEAARIAAFEVQDPDISNSDNETGSAARAAPSSTASYGVAVSADGEGTVRNAKKRKAARAQTEKEQQGGSRGVADGTQSREAVVVPMVGLRKPKRNAAAMVAAREGRTVGGRKRSKPGSGEEVGGGDVEEADDEAMPCIGEGLGWDDLS